MLVYGNKNSIVYYHLNLFIYLYDFFYVATSFIFGLLIDKFGFKKINIIISCIEIGVSCTFYFSVYIFVIYTIEIVLISCCLSCTFITIAPLFYKAFGKEIALEIYGISIIFLFVPFMTTEFLKEFLLKERKDYLILYLIGGGISLIKLIGLIFFKENKLYEFKNNKEEDYNKIEKLSDIGIDN